MLTTNNLSVEIEWKEILKNINLTFEPWKNYCILGKNWSWKSSLAMTIMWHPKYKITNGKISLSSEERLGEVTEVDLNSLSPHKRAELGIFLAFQNIPEIKWVKLFEFLKSIYDTKQWKITSFIAFKKIIEPLLAELKIDREFLWRDINVGFSGGERRKTEILQIKLLEPTYIFLDEVDSWLDVDALNDIANHIKDVNHGENSLIIITHLFKIVDNLPIDAVHVMKDWEIIKSWDHTLMKQISQNWFENM